MKKTLPLQSVSDKTDVDQHPEAEKYWRDGRVVECGGLENR